MIGIAKHSETLEVFVIYQARYGDRQIWARPLKLFTDTVKVNDEAVINLKPKQIGPFISEVLTLGTNDVHGEVSLIKPDDQAPIGSRMY